MSMEEKQKECLAVRLLAEYADMDRYIYLTFFIDKENLDLIDMHLMVSGNYDLFHILESAELYNYVELDENIYNDIIFPCDELKENIYKIFEDRENKVKIVDYLSEEDVISVIDIFADTLNAFMDFNIGIYDLKYGSFPKADIKRLEERVGEDIINKKFGLGEYNSDSEDEEYSLEKSIIENHKLINASLVVSPVWGTPINEVKAGDMIVVSINSNLYEEHMIYIESNGKKDDYSKYLIPGEILEKTVNENGDKLIIKLTDDYYTIIEESEPIKLKMFDPDKDIYVNPMSYYDNIGEKINLITKFFDNLSIFKLIMYGLGITSLFVLFYILYVVIFQ